MNNYLEYEPEDFAGDDFFIHWVKSTDLAAEAFWQDWLETYPFKRAAVETARQLVLLTQNMPEVQVSDPEMDDLKTAIFDRIDAAERPVRKLWSYVPAWMAAAGVAVLLVVSGWFLTKQNRGASGDYKAIVAEASERYDLVEVENLNKPVTLVNLPDGSSVILKKGSRLSYPQQFEASSREVYLTGEGFFEIARNAEKPFYVHANQITTKVLGTSFKVRAYPGEAEALVSVTTGRVSVYKSDRPVSEAAKSDRSLSGLVLTARQLAVYSNDKVTRLETASQPTSAVPREEMRFEYEEAPISTVFADIEKAYGISVVYDSTVIGSCPVTASLTGEPLNEKLNLLCKAVHAGYERVNGQIIVSGRGCR